MSRSGSSLSNSSQTRADSPELMIPKWNIHTPQYDVHGQLLDAMTRKYPPPSTELSVAELLSLPPLPKSFLYEMKKTEAERKVAGKSDQQIKEELEAAKARLRGFAKALK